MRDSILLHWIPHSPFPLPTQFISNSQFEIVKAPKQIARWSCDRLLRKSSTVVKSMTHLSLCNSEIKRFTKPRILICGMVKEAPNVFEFDETFLDWTSWHCFYCGFWTHFMKFNNITWFVSCHTECQAFDNYEKFDFKHLWKSQKFSITSVKSSPQCLMVSFWFYSNPN